MEILVYFIFSLHFVSKYADAGGHGGKHHKIIKIHVPEIINHEHHTKYITIHHHQPKKHHSHKHKPHGHGHGHGGHGHKHYHHYWHHHHRNENKHSHKTSHGGGEHQHKKTLHVTPKFPHHEVKKTHHTEHKHETHDSPFPSYGYPQNDIPTGYFEDVPKVYGVSYTNKEVKMFGDKPFNSGYEVTENEQDVPESSQDFSQEGFDLGYGYADTYPGATPNINAFSSGNNELIDQSMPDYTSNGQSDVSSIPSFDYGIGLKQNTDHIVPNVENQDIGILGGQNDLPVFPTPEPRIGDTISDSEIKPEGYKSVGGYQTVVQSGGHKTLVY